MFRGTLSSLECICRYIALVDCICMEDVWHANLTCRGHPHVPGNISSLNVFLIAVFCHDEYGCQNNLLYENKN